MAFDLGDITIFYSYQTVVAFSNSSGLTVRENSWGPTTGKHINAIDNGNKKDRIPSAEFETALLEALNAPEMSEEAFGNSKYNEGFDAALEEAEHKKALS